MRISRVYQVREREKERERARKSEREREKERERECVCERESKHIHHDLPAVNMHIFACMTAHMHIYHKLHTKMNMFKEPWYQRPPSEVAICIDNVFFSPHFVVYECRVYGQGLRE